MEYANTYATIDLDAIRDNFRAVARKAGAKVMAVVKADAYGHGAVPVARLLEPECAFFGVSSVSEALELRRAGIQKSILVLGPASPAACGAMVAEDIRATVCSWEDAQALSQAAVAQNRPARVHIAVDTGMSRIGFQVTEEAADICAGIAGLPGVEVEGLFSHFATADAADLTETNAQAERFARFDGMLKDRGVAIPLRHLDNSAGIMRFGSHYEMVRAGIMLYGHYPTEEGERDDLPLRPAMQWYSRVSHVKTLEPGRAISYGGTFVTQRPTLAATVPVGYADGYRRSLSNRFYVLIRGKQAPILGRVCMDQIVVDVTDIPDAAPGDQVVLIGKSGDAEITAEDLAEACGSFHYEQVCDLCRRVPRVYIQNGKRTAEVNYLLDK